MNLIAATPFLPSPAVPYVRISLFIATRWKPLPPRHYCDTQAHRHYSHCSCPQRPFAKRGYVVHLHHRYYGLIRQSDKILPTSDFNPYTEGLWHSKADPAYLSDLPQFTLRVLFHMPPSIPRRAISLHMSVSTRNASVFAPIPQARHPLSCPCHLPSRTAGRAD